MKVDNILQFAVPVTALIATLFALRKLYQWLRPIRVEPSFKLFSDKSKQDEICAKIVNRSAEPQYILSCIARGTYSLRYILMRHIRHPLARPSLYPTIWYGAIVYNLMEGEAIRLELHQPVEISCKLFDHPLNAMYTPYFLIKVKLSSGKTVRSKKLQAPKRWKHIGRKFIKNESEFVETIHKKINNSGHTVPSESIQRSLFSVENIPRVDPKTLRITVHSSEGHTIKGATAVAIAENDTTKSGTTNDDGIVELVIPTRRAYKLLIAHPEYPGAIIHAWDPGEDVNITLAVTENTGSVICMRTGCIPGLSGGLNPILDTSDRTYLYAGNIAIDGGKNQPATFRVDEPFELEDANGVVMQVRVLHIQGSTSLLQYVRARYDS